MAGYKEHVIDYTNRELSNMSNNLNPRRDTKDYVTIAKIQGYEASLTAGEIEPEVFLGCVSTIFKNLPAENANDESKSEDIEEKESVTLTPEESNKFALASASCIICFVRPREE